MGYKFSFAKIQSRERKKKGLKFIFILFFIMVKFCPYSHKSSFNLQLSDLDEIHLIMEFDLSSIFSLQI